MHIVYNFKNSAYLSICENPHVRDYDISDQRGSGGAHNMWDIYDAVKKSGKTNCSVWIFDKNKHLNGLDKIKDSVKK
jgi:hypothetical protein